MAGSSIAVQKRGFHSTGACLAVILVLCVLQALLAIELNEKFYSRFGPFYDSLSYYNQLARTMTLSQDKGLFAAIAHTSGSGTVFLPMFLGAFLGVLFQPDREMGVWLQSLWIFALLASLWTYFRVCLKAGPWLALVLTLPFASIHAIYFHNGGLPDFRMDLHLYLLFGCTIAWLYVALETQKLAAWITCGVFVACCSLSRATAPVYLILTMGPTMLGYWLARGRTAFLPMLRGGLAAGVTALVLALWFYVLNFEGLHFYYVVWNIDANADLPLREAGRHVQFALDSTGRPMLITAGLASALLLWPALSRVTPRSLLYFWNAPQFWKLAPAVVPVAFLVFRGAGLNPFVSMPGAFGVLFFILSLPGDLGQPRRWMKVGVGAVVVIGCLFAAWSGAKNFLPERGVYGSAAAYKEIIKTITQDAKDRGLPRVYTGSVTIGNYVDYAVENILVHDFGYRERDGVLVKDDLEYSVSKGSRFVPAAKPEWERDEFAGKTPEEIIDGLAEKARAEIHYVILPTDATAEFMRKHRSFVFIHQYSGQFRDEILARGRWEPVSEEIKVTKQERFVIYVNAELAPRP